MSGSAASKSKAIEDAHFDVTPLVDLVFMMNLYFLVVWVMTALVEVNLPPAKHVIASDADEMIVIGINKVDQGIGVFFLDDKSDPTAPITNPAEIEQRVKQVLASGAQEPKSTSNSEKKDTVLVKAAREVKLRDLAKVTSLVTAAKLKLRMAVMERD